MNVTEVETIVSPQREKSRLDYLDATRALALLVGILFHASLSFLPFFMGWAVQDISTSPLVATFVTICHAFRMETFFLLAGVLSQVAVHRKGAGAFARSRVLRIGVPFVAGWFVLRPLLVSGWIMGSASLRGNYDFWAGIRGGFETLRSFPAGMFTGTHLWFLYYLAMITGLTLAFRELVKLTGSWHVAMARRADALLAWLANSWLLLPLLAVPTGFALWFMRNWGMDTPDQSLQPQVPVIAVYGGFFVLGWMLGRQDELIAHFARLTPQRWLFAAVGLAAISFLGQFQLELSHPHFVAAHVAYVLNYALTMWSLVFLALGVFKRLGSRPHPFVRYMADSSYWLYLIHLPMVVWLQVAVAEVALHWSLKLAFIAALTMAAGLITYDLFVRSTLIGRVLNGRRRDRALPILFGNLRRRDPAVV